MHKKSKRFPCRLCVVYSRGWVECETVETVKVQKKKKIQTSGFSAVEIDFCEVLRGKYPRFVHLFCLVPRCHLIMLGPLLYEPSKRTGPVVVVLRQSVLFFKITGWAGMKLRMTMSPFERLFPAAKLTDFPSLKPVRRKIEILL